MSLDEASAQMIEQLVASGAKPIAEMTPTEARSFGSQMCALFGPGPDMERVENRHVPSADGASIPVRVLVPGGSPTGVIVWYHGGGWVIGSIDECDTLGRILAQRTGAAVVLVDYRLAPEHKFPAAVDDAWAAMCWVDRELGQLIGRRVPLIAAGDSAGGNLAAVVSQKGRSQGAPRIDAQLLVYPVTDCDFTRSTYVDPDNQLLLTRAAMVWFWDQYLTDRADRRDPRVSPLRSEDLSGLPPAIVVTAEHDPLREEGEAYASALSAAGVAVRHRRFDGQMHGFFTMVNVLPGSASAIDYVVEQLGPFLLEQSDGAGAN